MTFEEPPATPKLRLVAMIWGAVGIVALIVGLVAKLTAVAIFGALALVAGILVYSAQSYREASAARTRRRMAGGPVPPMPAPGTVPDVGLGSVPSGLEGRSGYRRRPWLRNDVYESEAEGPSSGDVHADGSDGGERTDGSEPSDGSDASHASDDGTHADQAGDGLSDLETGDEDTHSQTISEQDDGYGNSPDDGEPTDRTS